MANSIHIWKLSLNTNERFAKSSVFESIWNFLKDRYICEIWPQKTPKKKFHNSKTRKKKVWNPDHCMSEHSTKQKIGDVFFCKYFLENTFFLHFSVVFFSNFIFYVHRMTQPLLRFSWKIANCFPWQSIVLYEDITR